jgi:chromosome segregation ATPase
VGWLNLKLLLRYYEQCRSGQELELAHEIVDGDIFLVKAGQALVWDIFANGASMSSSLNINQLVAIDEIIDGDVWFLRSRHQEAVRALLEEADDWEDCSNELEELQQRVAELERQNADLQDRQKKLEAENATLSLRATKATSHIGKIGQALVRAGNRLTAG